jgi:hypothetical protein
MPTVLWVLKSNTRARSFYERMGGRLLGEKSVSIGPRLYAEVSYGWER